MDAVSVQWPKYSVSNVFSFSHCPSELLSLPSIIALPCPILSSSHCVCVKKLVPLLGQGAGMPGWKAPGGTLFEPLLSPWFDAVHLSVVGCLCQAHQEVYYFRPLQRQSLSLPPSLKSPHPQVLLSSPVAEKLGHRVSPSIFCLGSETTGIISRFTEIQSMN